MVTATSLLNYITYKAIDILVIKPYISVLRDLPGPEKLDSYILGHLPRIFKAPVGVIKNGTVRRSSIAVLVCPANSSLWTLKLSPIS
ncbi:hypothetical protein FRB95_010332 [Tulasnella sp. JGI-2019a]|nr:hypothetical protein FRB95_010332 [Tulasnella sp. JGI-2019a]